MAGGWRLPSDRIAPVPSLVAGGSYYRQQWLGRAVGW
jgi:hypothetical protein